LVLQGRKDALDNAVTNLKAMKWQAMQVRGEIECNDKKLKDGIHEVEKVSEVVEKMEELQLGDWCLSALRMK
jgi:2C-methyl-D-erythritol 2,4-cyclodiphosphate synthase